MSAGRYSFTIEQGATLDFELAYKDSDNNPVDLTGYQGRMQLRPSAGSDIKYITLSSSLDADGTGLNFSGSNGLNPPTSGTIGIFISAESSSLLSFNEAVYDLELATGSEFPIVTRLLEGQVRLSLNVTSGSF
tara:strand:+ start:352 stop:750 length:399 start_codon:yes stop_codon:yes gene_type:complete